MSSDKQCLRGINWGNVNFDDKNLIFENKGKIITKLSLKKLANSIQNRNDIILELNTDDLKEDEDELCEVRFFVPGQENQRDGQKNDEEQDDQQNSQSEENKQTEPPYAQTLCQTIIQKAQLGQVVGNSIFTLIEIPLAVPRGKYTIDMYKNFFQMHGMSFNYRIEYKNISKAFLLPLSDDIHVSIVLKLDQPVKQGSTGYQYLVMNFKKETEQTIKLNVNIEELKQQGYNQIKEEYSGALYEQVATIFKEFVGINIITPGDYKSADSKSCIKCTLKTHQGLLFPLKNDLIFINKPGYIPLKEIKVVEFHRIGHSNLNKLFDVKIIYNQQAATFVGFERKELDPLLKYFENKKIKIKKVDDFENVDEKKKGFAKEKDDDDYDSDSEDDEDFNANSESSESSSQENESEYSE